MSTTCARCGIPKWFDGGSKQEFGTCMAEVDQTEPEEIIACRDRQIAAQAALLRSVTGKLEEALGCIQEELPSQAAALIDSVLEVLS